MTRRPIDPTPDPFGADEMATGQERAGRDWLPASMAQSRVLIVDDVPSMRRILRNLLQGIGCQRIVEAGDGLSALAELQNRAFDLVISDLSMPGMNGIELLRTIRADARLEEIPVLIISAQARREHIAAAAAAGVDGYLLKPFTAAALEQQLHEMLTRGPRHTVKKGK